MFADCFQEICQNIATLKSQTSLESNLVTKSKWAIRVKFFLVREEGGNDSGLLVPLVNYLWKPFLKRALRVQYTCPNLHFEGSHRFGCVNYMLACLLSQAHHVLTFSPLYYLLISFTGKYWNIRLGLLTFPDSWKTRIFFRQEFSPKKNNKHRAQHCVLWHLFFNYLYKFMNSSEGNLFGLRYSAQAWFYLVISISLYRFLSLLESLYLIRNNLAW